MRRRPIRYITIACAILPLVIAVVLFFFLPDSIPGHMSHGVIDRYGNKAEIFIIPATNIFLLLMFAGSFKIMFMVNQNVNPQKLRLALDIGALIVDSTFLVLCVVYFVWISSVVFA